MKVSITPLCLAIAYGTREIQTKRFNFIFVLVLNHHVQFAFYPRLAAKGISHIRSCKSHSFLVYVFSFSHTGNVRILEVNPDGNYVRIFNTSGFKVSSILTSKYLSLKVCVGLGPWVYRTSFLSQFLRMNYAYRVLVISKLAFLFAFSSSTLSFNGDARFPS